VKVLHVVLSLDCGGLERVVINLVREGQQLGQAVHVLCLERAGVFGGEVEALHAGPICLHKRPGVRLEMIGRIRRVIRRLEPDVVHTHQIGALFYAGPASRSVNGAVVVHTEHGKNYHERQRTRWLGRLAVPFASRFLCVSRDIADEVIACNVAPAHKVGVVPNGIDIASCDDEPPHVLRKRLGIPLDAPVVGNIGRLHESKCQALILRAFAAIRPSAPRAHLLIVGDGPCMGELRSLASALGIKDRAHFPGFEPRPLKYLRTMDVFALASRTEGMPLSVLEAWHAGVPVVASRVGGVPELIDDRRCGMSFDAGDLQGLVRGITVLLSDRRLARQMADAAQNLVRAKFTSAAMAGAYHRHYRELLQR
jgi:glycosyltransferase involved in cell wall biosynthesis